LTVFYLLIPFSNKKIVRVYRVSVTNSAESLLRICEL
jgi:hypothetical protein